MADRQQTPERQEEISDRSKRSYTSSKSVSSPPAKTAAKAKFAATEVPSLPPTIFTAFERPKEELAQAGATEYDIAMRLENKIGTFYTRTNGELGRVFVNIQATEYREGMRRTLDEVIARSLRAKGYTDENDIENRLAVILPDLINGICVMTYLKLRSVNLRIPDQSSKFYSKPKTPAPFEVPVPYAIAIQQLGILEASSQIKRTAYIPTLTAADGQSTLLPAGQRWNPTSYAQAVEFCKSIGMRFQSVDLSVKIGSAWWLYSPVTEGDYFELRCILPEDNFTESGAVLHSLYLHAADDGPDNAIMDLSAISNKNYGSMLRNPPQGISVNSFFAINNDVAQVWDYED